jgi:hypothetical protein
MPLGRRRTRTIVLSEEEEEGEIFHFFISLKRKPPPLSLQIVHVIHHVPVETCECVPASNLRLQTSSSNNGPLRSTLSLSLSLSLSERSTVLLYRRHKAAQQTQGPFKLKI